MDEYIGKKYVSTTQAIGSPVDNNNSESITISNGDIFIVDRRDIGRTGYTCRIIKARRANAGDEFYASPAWIDMACDLLEGKIEQQAECTCPSIDLAGAGHHFNCAWMKKRKGNVG